MPCLPVIMVTQSNFRFMKVSHFFPFVFITVTDSSEIGKRKQFYDPYNDYADLWWISTSRAWNISKSLSILCDKVLPPVIISIKNLTSPQTVNTWGCWQWWTQFERNIPVSVFVYRVEICCDYTPAWRDTQDMWKYCHSEIHWSCKPWQLCLLHYITWSRGEEDIYQRQSDSILLQKWWIVKLYRWNQRCSSFRPV